MYRTYRLGQLVELNVMMMLISRFLRIILCLQNEDYVITLMSCETYMDMRIVFLLWMWIGTGAVLLFFGA